LHAEGGLFTDKTRADAIDFTGAEASQTLTYVRGGKLKAFAVMARTRWPALPDVPTTDEIGALGMYISFWHGLWVPAGTPKEVIAKLNVAVVAALADTVVRQRLTDLGLVIAAREQQTPVALADFQRAEIQKWWPFIKAANIKVESH
jgi:tripartite-type tricarboxylate transporter receptor subunit TctC